MSLNISSKLTENGIRGIYEKLFDSSVLYNRTFFSDKNTLLKLRLYKGSSYVESVEESYELIDHSIIFTYYFSNKITYGIDAVRLYNGSELMMEITGLDLNSYCVFNAKKNIVITKYTMSQVTQCIPKKAYEYMIKSLVNEIDFKINRLYIGNGVPDLSGDSSHLTNTIASYSLMKGVPSVDTNDFEDDLTTLYNKKALVTDATNKFNLYNMFFSGNTLRLVIKSNDAKMTITDITELGLGTDNLVITDDSWFEDDLNKDKVHALITDVGVNNSELLCTLQEVDFSKFNYSDKYIIEILLRIV